MNYSKIKWVDVANGVGVRISLFVSGCRHGCPGCFNPEAWSFQAGEDFSSEVEESVVKALGASYIHGLSLLGGEPLEPENQEAVLALVKKVKETYPTKDIWCYTGFVYEDLVAGQVGEWMEQLLPYLDILVDGRFEESQHNLSLRFRGSENQRVISVGESLERGQLVLWSGLTPEE